MGYLSQVVRDARPRPTARAPSPGAGQAAPDTGPTTYARLIESGLRQPELSPGLHQGTENGSHAAPPEDTDLSDERIEAVSDPAQRPPTPASRRMPAPQQVSPAAMDPDVRREAPPEVLRPLRVHAPTGAPDGSGRPLSAKGAGTDGTRAPTFPKPQGTRPSRLISPEIRASQVREAPARRAAPSDFDPDIARPEAGATDRPLRPDAARRAEKVAPAAISPQIVAPPVLPPSATSETSGPFHAPADAATEVRIGQVEIVVEAPAAPAARSRRSPPAPGISPSRYHVRRV